jgi:monovalent cation:H+ antiporter-2, CPA2 family
MGQFAQVLLLLGVTVSVVVLFNRFHVRSSLGYLLVPRRSSPRRSRRRVS